MMRLVMHKLEALAERIVERGCSADNNSWIDFDYYDGISVNELKLREQLMDVLEEAFRLGAEEGAKLAKAEAKILEKLKNIK